MQPKPRVALGGEGRGTGESGEEKDVSTDTGQAGPQAPAKAETAAPSWEDALPFTLTLNVDFATIGDHEDFKQGILADVAAAAKVDVIYFKIQMLCAGSVIVHLLIASEVGEPRKVLQDLQEQANSPDSCLMAGKLTSKTKNLKEGFDDMALFQVLEKSKVIRETGRSKDSASALREKGRLSVAVEVCRCVCVRELVGVECMCLLAYTPFSCALAP
jgi:hypothetical protein